MSLLDAISFCLFVVQLGQLPAFYVLLFIESIDEPSVSPEQGSELHHLVEYK